MNQAGKGKGDQGLGLELPSGARSRNGLFTEMNRLAHGDGRGQVFFFWKNGCQVGGLRAK